MTRGLDSVAERFYETFYEDEDARVCKDITDEACQVVSGNFLRNTLAQAATKLGDALINPKTTLPWLLTSLQAPGWIASLLVPIRESGSMLPQLGIAVWVRGLPIRKWCCVGAAFAQGVAVLGLAAAGWRLDGTAAGLAILALVVLFSLARGFSSVATKDVLGKTVPRTRRGQVGGLAASVAGFGTLLFAALLWWRGESQELYVALLVAGALLWFLSAWFYATVAEQPGATEGGGNGLREAVASLRILREDRDFRRFLTARALLMGSGLAAPFLVVLARERADTGLSYFLIAQGVASLVSGPVWGVAADRSSRALMMVTAIGAGLLGTAVYAADRWSADLVATVWFLPAAFFVLSIVHDGVRLARKTYVVDLAGGNKRTDYVAVGNSVIGVLLLLVGGLTAAVQQLSTAAALLLLSLAAFGAAWVARGLPEVQR